MKFNRNAAGHLPSLSAKAKAQKQPQLPLLPLYPFPFFPSTPSFLPLCVYEAMRYENQSPTFMNCCGAASVQLQVEIVAVAVADAAATSNVQHFSQRLRLPRNHKTSPLAPHKNPKKKTKEREKENQKNEKRAQRQTETKIRARHTRR